MIHTGLLVLIVMELAAILWTMFVLGSRAKLTPPPSVSPPPGLSRVLRPAGNVTIPKHLLAPYSGLTDTERAEYEIWVKQVSAGEWTPCEFVRDYTAAWHAAHDTLGLALRLSDGTFIVGRNRD